jgi:hypothetical protein
MEKIYKRYMTKTSSHGEDTQNICADISSTGESIPGNHLENSSHREDIRERTLKKKHQRVGVLFLSVYLPPHSE